MQKCSCREYFGRVDMQKCSCQGCTRIFWSSRYIEMQLSGMRKNILVKQIHRNVIVRDAQEYVCRVGMQKCSCRGCARILGSVLLYCHSRYYKYTKEYLKEKVAFVPYMKHVNLPQVRWRLHFPKCWYYCLKLICPTLVYEKCHEVPLLCYIVPVLINPEDPWIPTGYYNNGCISEVILQYYSTTGRKSGFCQGTRTGQLVRQKR